MELTRQTGNEPPLVGLMRVYKDYYPDVIVGDVVIGRASVFTVCLLLIKLEPGIHKTLPSIRIMNGVTGFGKFRHSMLRERGRNQLLSDEPSESLDRVRGQKAL